tara:strand:+ start:138 stop:746 length:609 start_codon:yes stop_codon:yes gene_type:complete
MYNNKTMNKYIIIEGPDNTGKDTQIKQIIKNFDNECFHMFHYFNLPFKGDKKKHKDYSIKMYDEMFKIMKDAPKDINYIFNRSHLGESVYSPLYRGYLGDYVFDIENKYTEYLRQELYLITLVSDPSLILKRDDGKSFYKNEEEVKGEIDGFVRAHRKSTIKNKLLLDIGKMSIEEVSNVIKQFILEANQPVTPDDQLKLFK